MPSKKPQFVIRTDKEVLQKIAYIAQENERNSTQEIVYLIKQRIKEYEAEHGEIVIREPEKPEMRIPLLDPYHLGVKTGEKAADIVIDQVKKQRRKKQETPERPG